MWGLVPSTFLQLTKNDEPRSVPLFPFHVMPQAPRRASRSDRAPGSLGDFSTTGPPGPLPLAPVYMGKALWPTLARFSEFQTLPRFAFVLPGHGRLGDEFSAHC